MNGELCILLKPAGECRVSHQGIQQILRRRPDDARVEHLYRDIEPAGGPYGIALVPDMIGRFRAVAKLGDYDGRLLLVDEGGAVIDLPGPAHYLAHGRFLVVEHHSDANGVTIYDLSASLLTFAADGAVLSGILGMPVSEFRWVELDHAVYLAGRPLRDGIGWPTVRLDEKNGGLVPAKLTAEELARATPIHLSGLEEWKNCSCGRKSQNSGVTE